MLGKFDTDIAIIGAGPTGLFSVFQAGMLGMRCHVIDTLEMVGGQCKALYPEKPIYDIPGFPSVDGAELIDRLTEQAKPFGPEYHLHQQVVKLDTLPDGRLELTTSKSNVITAKAVIIAAGAGAFGPNRPPLSGIEEYEGKSIFYFVNRRKDFVGKRVVIAGGGDSAVDWAVNLAYAAKHISVIHRRDKFRCAPDSYAKLKRLSDEGTLELVIPYQLHGLVGKNGHLTHVEVSTLEGEIRTLEADVLLPFFGLAMELGPIADWGITIEHKHIPVNPATLETNRRGIFAIGDIATYPGKLKLILQGFSEAAMALHAAFPIVFPSKALHFEYSTTKGVPLEAV